jgi:hypothetical protein
MKTLKDVVRFIRLTRPRGVSSVTKTYFEMTLEALKEIYSEAGVMLRREQGKLGGHPLSDKPRCPCGEMTEKRAKARAHYCTPDGPVFTANRRGLYDRKKKSTLASRRPN